MTHYSVVAVTPTTDAWIPGYLAVVGPLVEKHGGRYLARSTSHERLEGEGPAPAVQVIIEWPSKEAESAFYGDPGYKDQLAARLNGAVCSWLSVGDKDDFAS